MCQIETIYTLCRFGLQESTTTNQLGVAEDDQRKERFTRRSWQPCKMANPLLHLYPFPGPRCCACWQLSRLMFLTWGMSSWALAVAIWSQVKTTAWKVGLWFLVIAGLGEDMASVFDVTHDPGHSIAGVLGMGGFPIAALLLSVSLGRLHAQKAACGSAYTRSPR